MKKLLLLLLLLSSVMVNAQEKFVCKHADAVAKMYNAEQVNYPGDSSIDAKYYWLDLNINTNTHQIKGMVQIEATAVNDGLQECYFDLRNSLPVDSVVFHNNSGTYVHEDHKVTLTFDSTLAKDESFLVDIYYAGTPGSSGFGSFEFSNQGGYPAIWSLSEPYGASDWWVCKDTPADKVDSCDVWITTDSSLTSVSNGLLQEVLDNIDGTKTYKWKHRYPIAQYLISIAITNYVLYEDYFHYSETDSMLIAHYNYPNHFTNSRISDLNKTNEMLQVFSDKFGMYPFVEEKYGHAEFGWGGGMEHQTISSMGAFYESIVAHELGHQWFGDKITCADWQNIWLNEGFATYLEAVWTEHKYGFEAYQNEMASNITRARSATGTLYVEDISSVNQIFNGARSYDKGSVLLHMLRGILGDDMFWECMKAYSQHPDLEYDVAVTEDLQEVFETTSGMDLDYFFQEWVYGERYPFYNFNWEYEPTGTDDYYNVSIHINQDVEKATQFFTMPIQFEIENSFSDTTVTVFNDTQDQVASFVVKGIPTNLNIDPDRWIMKRIDSQTTDVEEDGLLAPTEYSLGNNYPNPFNPSTTISYQLPEPGRVKITLFNSLGEKVTDLVNEFNNAGTHTVKLEAGNLQLASGVYFYRMDINNFTATKKLVLLK